MFFTQIYTLENGELSCLMFVYKLHLDFARNFLLTFDRRHSYFRSISALKFAVATGNGRLTEKVMKNINNHLTFLILNTFFSLRIKKFRTSSYGRDKCKCSNLFCAFLSSSIEDLFCFLCRIFFYFICVVRHFQKNRLALDCVCVCILID